jgi:polysaccharide export outer membrane protein
MPKDQLTITVHTTDPAAAQPFNLTVRHGLGANNSVSNSGGSLMGYLVDNNGDIDFPVLGKIHVQGLTKRQCEDMIRERIIPYMAKTENPLVVVRMSSFKVTVLGEVGRSGSISVAQEKVNILEALAQAGDLTIYGKRDNVLLLREDEMGQKHQYRINLNDANLINSPLYYLQQNDIVYVEPNTVKAKNSDIGSSTTIWFSFISIATSVASLLVNILR